MLVACDWLTSLTIHGQMSLFGVYSHRLTLEYKHNAGLTGVSYPARAGVYMLVLSFPSVTVVSDR